MTGNVTVLGATGFIGGSVVARLSAGGWRVTALGRKGRVPGAARMVLGDARDRETLSRALARADVVVNLLGQITKPLFESVEVNGPAMAALGELLSARRLPLVHVSTVAVYGAARVADEARQPDPVTPYGALRLSAERILACRAPRAVFLRCTNVFGPGQRRGLMSYLARQRRSSRRLFFDHDGSMRRDFIHVEDVAEAVALTLARRMKTGVAIVNLGSGRQHSVKQVVAVCQRAWGVSYRVSWGRIPARDNIGRIPLDRLLLLTGSRPRRTLSEFINEAA